MPDIEQEHDMSVTQELKKDTLPYVNTGGVKNAYLKKLILSCKNWRVV